MRDAVVSGTGRSLSNHPWRIAENGHGGSPRVASHAWFVGYAPFGPATRRDPRSPSSSNTPATAGGRPGRWRDRDGPRLRGRQVASSAVDGSNVDIPGKAREAGIEDRAHASPAPHNAWRERAPASRWRSPMRLSGARAEVQPAGQRHPLFPFNRLEPVGRGASRHEEARARLEAVFDGRRRCRTDPRSAAVGRL
jgi:hypothetical protein